jgi:hypothetical protein
MNDHDRILKEIKETPDNHRHEDLNALTSCCMINGAIDLAVMQAHEGLCGENGGVKCDVRSGPCACGAWH